MRNTRSIEIFKSYNTSFSLSAQIIAEGEDAVFDVTAEAQAWSNGSGPRVAVTVRPLADVANAFAGTEHLRVRPLSFAIRFLYILINGMPIC